MLAEYGMVLIYIGCFGISDLFVSNFKLTYFYKILYYVFLFLLGSLVYYLYNTH